MIQTQAARVGDFSGGIVDNYINSAVNRAQIFNNLLVLNDRTALTRPGSVVDDTVNPQIPVGVQQIRTLINFDNDDALFVHSAKRLYFRNPSAYSTLTGPTGNHLLDVGDVNSILAQTQWKGHCFITSNDFPKIQKVYRDNAGVLRLRNAGLPGLASAPVVTIGLAGAKNYIYAFHYAYLYNRAQEEFADFGPVTLVEVNGSADPGATPNSISVIPVLANGATNNWDTAAIKVYIFRSVDAGTTYYKIGEVTNGTTVFSDTFADSAISDNEVIYTEGGVVDNDEPPKAKYIHVVQNKMYYAHLREGAETLPFDILQSKDADQDAVPATFRDTVEDRITGLSSVREIPIVLCERKIYRIDGSFDDLGRGFMLHVRLHDSAGCISNNSCVQANQGLFWCGNDGFYYCDGQAVKKVSQHLNNTYRLWLAAIQETGNVERITGKFDAIANVITWSAQLDSASLENDSIVLLDLNYGISDEMPFRTWDGGENFKPSAIEYFNGDLHRADTRGYVFRHNEEFATDPRVDTAAAAAAWKKAAIIYTYRGPASNFGTDLVRKWVPRMSLQAKNRSNISIQINVINDDGKFSRSLSEIRYRNNLIWGDPEFFWGNPECVWNAEGLIEEWRRVPSRGLRCSLLQVEITNALTTITNSDTLGKATVNSALKTVMLDNAVDNDWPADSVDYFISFEVDNYETQYLVSAFLPDTLTFLDPSNLVVSGSQKWLLKGFRKEDILNLLSYTVHFAPLSKSQTNLAGINTGANA